MRQTSQHRIQSFAFVISVWAAVCFSWSFVLDFGAAEPTGGPQATQLEGRINPNDAPIESLVRLPGLGIGRAGAIVAYREDVNREGKRPAFQNCDDLQKVRGIGPKTVQSISEWITFE